MQSRLFHRNDGSYTINVTAPDTITSWIVSAFSISDELGLGIADTYKVIFRLCVNLFIALQKVQLDH